MSVLLGANAYAAQDEDAVRRQAAALASWRALAGVRPINLQWPGEAFEVDGFETHALLRADARTVSRRQGPRKPVVSEVFDRLAEVAGRYGARWIGYANSDIHVTQGAVDRVVREGRDGFAFSRMDFDGETGADVEMVTAGVDLLVVSAQWWRANRDRFRAYPAGEPVWDNVYTSIFLCHGRGHLLNREPLVRHERHEAGQWQASPYARYVNLLAALDRPYFTLWARYHHELLRLRERGAPEAEEMDLQYHVFRHAPSLADRAVQAGRVLKARARWMIGR